eukprot:CAMPEP_0174730980 /NCGR_PEP_ID=MMETSP1094-20130205/56642_1 /TAXON_ID=156173 /ORGANISM="Chrysochromulina brevifilum, Strain UTEX LB 985" /LENGTH=56 /DNA_ID=CAMNT_0015933313 /DNA_START=219 /DNA_END=386 /DNA_ORIENTATION=+
MPIGPTAQVECVRISLQWPLEALALLAAHAHAAYRAPPAPRPALQSGLESPRHHRR